MSEMRRIGGLGLLGVAFLGALGPIQGEETATSTSYDEQVTVTASRTPVPIGETGSSVTVIERDEIEARQSLFLADLLRGVGGLAISRSGGAGSLTQSRLRGAEANHVLVLVDGVAVNDAFVSDELPLELMTSYDIERIEIVRGPQSGIWGSDALAGVINIVTRDLADKRAVEAEVEGGSFGTLRGGGRLNLARGNARIGIHGSWVDVDGTNAARTGAEDDGAQNATAGLRFLWDRPDGPWQVEVVGRHTEAEADFDGIDFVGTGLPSDDDRRTDTALSLVQAAGRWATPESRWRHELRAALASSDTESFLDSVPGERTGIDKRSLSFQSSFDVAPTASGLDQSWTFALDRETREFEQRGAASPFGDPNQDQELDATGAVVEYRIGARSRWSLSASLRHDENSDFEDATTYRTAASLRVGQHGTRLRANLGSGQKPPTFLERFGFFADQFVGNPDLAPEKSHGWEIGVDQSIGRATLLELTYFRATLEDEVNGFFFDPGLGLFTARNESADSDRQGVELALRTELARGTRIALTYTFTDATQPDSAGGDERELRRPRHMANLRARHTFAELPLELQVNLAYNGSQLDRFFPPFPQPEQFVRLDSYLLADVGVRYRMAQRIELFARVENALDESYEDVYGFATPGLGAYVALRYRASRP